MKKTTHNIIHEGSGSSKQSKTRQFMRQKIKEPAKKAWKRTKIIAQGAKEVTKFVFRHPKTAITTTAFALTLILTPVKTSAQDVSGKTELVSDKEPTDKYRETKLKDGMITFEGIGTFDVRDAMRLINGTENVSEGTQKLKIDATLEGVGKGVYYVFETGILGVFVNKDGKTLTLRSAASYGDALFLNAIFIADNGAIFATSPKMFIALTAKDSYPINYASWGDVPRLENPIFSSGKDKDNVDLRDPNVLGKEGVKIQFSFTRGTIKVVDDDTPPIGGADK